MIPKYDMARHRILTIIAENNYGIGTKLPDENVLSLKTGFSGITVRRAMKELENSGIISRIRGRGSFVKQRLELEHDIKKDNLLFIQVNSVNPEANNYALFEMWNICRMKGYKLSVLNAITPGTESTSLISNSSGVIVTGRITDEWIVYLDSTAIPYVVMGEYQSKREIDSMRYDWKLAIRGVLMEMIDKGCRKIAFFNGAERYLPSQCLYEEYCNILSENEITLDDRLVLWNATGEYRDKIADFFNSGTDFDGILMEWGNYPFALTLLLRNIAWHNIMLGVVCNKKINMKIEDNVFTACFDDNPISKCIEMLLKKISGEMAEKRTYYQKPVFNFKRNLK
ncbi:MAG: hypothetical protein A2017_13705 [Lentisphaerae bacterium GWF2_44_16]|nr:MAG: hypothetical protein A2017_13705 [Lentisphaerae bacterium GWF2_44_16]